MTQRLRPLVHLTAAEGWVNDAYGVHWDGETYRLYVQALPERTTWAPAAGWATATSDDLLHWSELEPALAPQPFETGCWSGCVVPETGAFYTRVSLPDIELGQVALARPEGRRFVSRADDVIVVAPGDVWAFRDPFVVRREDGWSMVVGAGMRDGSGAVLHYLSEDLEHWRYDGVLALLGAGAATVAECPQLIEVAEGEATRWALVVSLSRDGLGRHVVASLGDFDGHAFDAGPWHRLALGSSAYATTAFTDKDGQPCVMSWLRETGGAVPPRDHGGTAPPWTGTHSLPARATVDGDRLRLGPHPALGTGEPIASTELPACVRFTFDPRATREGVLWQAGSANLTLTATGEAIVVRAGSDGATLPLSVVEVVVDADVVELYGGAYAALRTAPVLSSRRLGFDGDPPEVRAIR